MAEGVVDLLLQGILIICTTKDCVARSVRIPGVILTGLKFRKSPRRKVFAVRKNSVKSRGFLSQLMTRLQKEARVCYPIQLSAWLMM